jgi:hypothetical protein
MLPQASLHPGRQDDEAAVAPVARKPERRPGLLATILEALDRSRRRDAARAIHHYRFLIDDARDHETRRADDPTSSIRGLPSVASPTSWRD